jgi:hypothetical protein
MNPEIQAILDNIKTRGIVSVSEADVEKIEAELNAKEKGPDPRDFILMRGGIEVALKNAFTGEDIQRAKGDNVILYCGRSWLMQKIASTGMDSTVTMAANVVIGTGSAATQATHTGPQGYFTYKTGTLTLTTQSAGAGVPVMAIAASWESTELTATGFNSIWEFLLNNSTGSAGTFFNRYLSNTYINATTSNQLLVTYSVSF